MSEIQKKARELLAESLRRRNEHRLAGMAEIPQGLDQIATHIALDAIATALQPQWQDISTAPRDGRPVLLDHPEWHTRVLRGGWDAHELAWRAHGFGCPATQPTKWMPLPAAPEVSE